MTMFQLATTDPAAGVALDLLVVLATAAGVAIAARRLRVSAVPAYLIAGAIVGPGALGFVEDPSRLDGVSRLALLLLLFGVGLQMDLPAMRGGVRGYVTACVGSTALSILLLWPAAMAFGLDAPAALLTAMAFSVSITSIVLKILGDRRELRTPQGRMALAILVLQDLLVLVMLAATPAIAHWATGRESGAGSGASGVELLAGAALKVGGVTGLIVFGKLVLPRLLLEAARGRSADVVMVAACATALGAALLTSRLGFSPELGAFVAGFMLADTAFRHQLAGQISPLRDLFMAVFFTSVGMRLEISELASTWWVVVLAGLIMTVIKAGTITLSCWAVGATASTAVMVGLALAQAGEFSFVLLAAGGALGVYDERTVATLLAIAVVSLLMTPLLIDIGRRLAARASHAPLAPWVGSPPGRLLSADGPRTAGAAAAASGKPESPRAKRVVLAGYGPVGRSVAEKLVGLGMELTIIELNPATVRTQMGLGKRVVYGDISNPEVIESAGVRDADAVVITIPDEEATLAACKTIRSMAPGIFIAARTDFLSKGLMARSFGADYVVVDEIATADAMQRALLDHFSAEATGAGEKMRTMFGVLRDERRPGGGV